MVGLSIVLEGQKPSCSNNNSSNHSSDSARVRVDRKSQVINKTTTISMVINSNNIAYSNTSNNNNNNYYCYSPSSSSSSVSSPTATPTPRTKSHTFSLPPAFLDQCFLCTNKLLPGKDIYMYRGDRAFCSEECRLRQILSDEEETLKNKKDNCSWAAIKPGSSSPSSTSQHRKAPKNRVARGGNGGGGGFVY